MSSPPRFGQFIMLQAPQKVRINGFRKSSIASWKEAYSLLDVNKQQYRSACSSYRKETTYYRFIVPAGTVGLLKAVTLDQHYDSYEMLIVNPITHTYRGPNNTLYLSRKDIDFNPIVPLDSPLRQLQADYILSRSAKESLLNKYQQIHELQTLNNI